MTTINPRYQEHGMFAVIGASVLNTFIMALILGGEPVLGIDQDGGLMFAVMPL